MSNTFKQCPTYFSKGGENVPRGGFAPPGYGPGSLICAAVKLSLFQENNLSNSIPHGVNVGKKVNHLLLYVET